MADEHRRPTRLDRPALFWGLVLGLAAAAAWWLACGRSLAGFLARLHSVNPVSMATVALVVLVALVALPSGGRRRTR